MNRQFSLLLTFSFLLQFGGVFGQSSSIQKAPLTVENIWKKNEFAAKRVGGFNGMKDGQHFTKFNVSKDGFTINKYSFQQLTSEGEIVVSSKDLIYDGKSLSVDDYQFNADETKLLLSSETKSVYRRSYITTYYIYDLKSKSLTPLDTQRAGSTLAEFSPNGEFVAYVYRNNIYVKQLASGKVTAVTTDGKTNALINGTTDWVYEEEFAITKGFGWSPDNSQIAYLKFDESAVKEYQLSYYGNLYPYIYNYKYPKAGEANSTVTLHLYSLAAKKSSAVSLGAYEYIPRMNWSQTENKLVVQTLNRHQNHVRYFLVEPGKTISAKQFYEEQSKTYIDIDDNLTILKDGKSLLRTSEKSGYNHIYRIYFDGSSEQITAGDWDVIEFSGINETTNVIHYSSAEYGAIYKTLFSIGLDGKNKLQLSEPTGYHHANYTEGMQYFLRVSSTANTPKSYTLCKADGTEIQVLENNDLLKAKLDAYNLSSKEFTQLQGATEKLNAWIIYPTNFDATKKYPVFFHVYGGPGSNTVKDEFEDQNYMYHQLLAQRGYIVVSVDPRGTQYRGEAFKKSTYLNLGKLELEDFIAVAKEMGNKPFVDAARIGIQGWSYGGYMSSLAMTKGKGVFKMGIAIAPVTNWRYYDNIYTERFLRTPQENPTGYDENSPINYAKDLTGNFLLIHGDADDNVHCQNTMDFTTALVNANIQFDQFIYPNKDHGIYGGNTRNHLFTHLFNYTLKNL